MAASIVLRIGQCCNCGECCTLFIEGQYQRCPHYDQAKAEHCKIYQKRPKECRQFPRGPMDLSNKPHCSFQFTDEWGHVIGDHQDRRVSLKYYGHVPTS